MTEKTSSLPIVSLAASQRLGQLAGPKQLEKIVQSAWKSLALPLLLFIALPLLALFLRTSPDRFFAELNQPQVIQAIKLSLFTSAVTTALTLAFGTPVAYLLAQRRFRFYRVVDTLVDLPTVLPPSVAGVALLMAFGRKGLFGPFLDSMGINIPFTLVAVILAQTFIASPFYVKAAAIGFAAIDPELKQAAALDGASRWQTFRYVVLPLSWMSLLSGSVMTWARALGEFGATIIFAGNFPGRTQTMPLAIYIGFEIDLNVALTLAVILVCFSFLTLILVKGILHRRLDTDREANAQ
ncbi:MAG: molybdate ABC transporter permease subunit [Chloroflexi bacterium]|nr:MAG: molybdate ABC transporter permease subunit [Chloroflexota bacterium]